MIEKFLTCTYIFLCARVILKKENQCYLRQSPTGVEGSSGRRPGREVKMILGH